jgi:acetyl-CoA synthetase
MKPFFGIKPAIFDPDGKAIEGAGSGNLVITDSWPGQMRTVYGDHQRFIDTYFKMYPGVYTTGDGAERDADGDWKITGRVDDVINVSGHRIGTAEIESAMMADARVAEAAVVGCPHDIKGTAIYAFVTPKEGVVPSDALKKELVSGIRERIGAFAAPEFLQWAPALPKTRSAKTMRRILRKIAEAGHNEVDLSTLGDTSTLADPSIVKRLYDERVRH